MTEGKCDIGLIGLGVMGQNLVLNMADHGFKVAVYNRSSEKTDGFISRLNPGQDVRPGYTLEEFTGLLRTPRSVILLVPAGSPVDDVIGKIKPLLQKGDLIIDGGNSHFSDTDRRADELSDSGLHFFGMGISGGERGARFGPSMMPGGPEKEYERVRDIFEAAAAQVDGSPCVTHLGPRSAGHYVKMVHNGIEYGLMQILAESYDLMKTGAGWDNQGLADMFKAWNQGSLEGFLVEITADIFRKKDDRTDKDLIDVILDKAEQKGTGKWTSDEAMELQVPTLTIDMAVSMRNMSSWKDERVEAQAVLPGPGTSFKGNSEVLAGSLKRAVLAAMIITYTQGMAMLKQASAEYGYRLKLADVARIWRGGCIIRAALLEDIRSAYKKNPGLNNLLLDDRLGGTVRENMKDLREIIRTAVELGLPMPALASAQAYYDSYRRGRLPVNLIQAQRDYFGSHTYKRVDADGTFHTQWYED